MFEFKPVFRLKSHHYAPVKFACEFDIGEPQSIKLSSYIKKRTNHNHLIGVK